MKYSIFITKLFIVLFPEQILQKGSLQMKKFNLSYLLIIITLFVILSCVHKPVPENYQSTLQLFQKPTVSYSTAPFWVWNDKVTHEKIDTQLLSYRSIGIMQLIIHPRPGLVTPYLTPEWFELVSYATEKAKSLGMKLWLYDENSYPSGLSLIH